MTFKERTEAFSRLGAILAEYRLDPEISGGTLNQACKRSMTENQWFTADNINIAIASVAEMLSNESLNNWISRYKIPDEEPLKKIAVIMAGNIPLVGFHDFLTVLLTGNRFYGKTSSEDKYLLPAVGNILTGIDERFGDRIVFTDGFLKEFDAVIATGSNSSAGYFEYYFAGVPHIIRKNRNAIAVVTGKETDEELSGIANDIFLYFGRGCRNVSRLMLPADYDISRFTKPFTAHSDIINHHKYNNNYTYQKSILQMNGEPFYDNGVLILRQADSISSPVGIVNYSFYNNEQEVEDFADGNRDAIQCIVSAGKFSFTTVKPGKAQHPDPEDYADGVDTVDFLLSLKKNL